MAQQTSHWVYWSTCNNVMAKWRWVLITCSYFHLEHCWTENKNIFFMRVISLWLDNIISFTVLITLQKSSYDLSINNDSCVFDDFKIIAFELFVDPVALIPDEGLLSWCQKKDILEGEHQFTRSWCFTLTTCPAIEISNFQNARLWYKCSKFKQLPPFFLPLCCFI